MENFRDRSYVVIALVFRTVLLVKTYIRNHLTRTSRMTGIDFMGAFTALHLSFAESVLFLSVAGRCKTKVKPHTIYLWALGRTFILLMIISATSSAWRAMIDISYFPT